MYRLRSWGTRLRSNVFSCIFVCLVGFDPGTSMDDDDDDDDDDAF